MVGYKVELSSTAPAISSLSGLQSREQKTVRKFSFQGHCVVYKGKRNGEGRVSQRVNLYLR